METNWFDAVERTVAVLVTTGKKRNTETETQRATQGSVRGNTSRHFPGPYHLRAMEGYPSLESAFFISLFSIAGEFRR